MVGIIFGVRNTCSLPHIRSPRDQRYEQKKRSLRSPNYALRLTESKSLRQSSKLIVCSASRVRVRARLFASVAFVRCLYCVANGGNAIGGYTSADFAMFVEFVDCIPFRFLN